MAARGYVKSDRVLDAMRRVPRHLFVPGAPLSEAYGDWPLGIGSGQTISQPSVVGEMTEALELNGPERVLEIGTGSGYQAAVLSVLAREVYTIEIVPELGERAEKRLRDLGYANVHVRVGDGYAGWPEHAPLIASCSPRRLPRCRRRCSISSPTAESWSRPSVRRTRRRSCYGSARRAGSSRANLSRTCASFRWSPSAGRSP